MSNKQLSPTAINLIKARDLIANPDDWCPEGVGLNGEAHDVVTGKTRRCILVALNHVEAYETIRERHFLDRAVQKLFPDLEYGDIIAVNEKGHEAAISLYNMAISDAIECAHVV